MPQIRQLVTQSGNDTSTHVAIDTNLTVDGKAGWQINSAIAYWVDGNTVPAADWKLDAVMNTIGSVSTFDSDDEIFRIGWGVQNTAGVAVATAYEPMKTAQFGEPRVTVQPILYLGVYSTATAQANDIVFIVQYDIVKLTDIEVLRLLAGGA